MSLETTDTKSNDANPLVSRDLWEFMDRYEREFGQTCREYLGNVIVLYQEDWDGNLYHDITDFEYIRSPKLVIHIHIIGKLVIDSNDIFRKYTRLEWITGKVPTITTTNLKGLFGYLCKFRGGNIGKWDVSGVTDMEGMFEHASEFNGDIGNWDVSSVTRMYAMFYNAISFNQPIGGWDVSNVKRMDFMFEDAMSFNQPIGEWDVSSVIDMEEMFSDATSFNQDISKWDVSRVRNIEHMFAGTIFDQDISGWDVKARSYRGVFLSSSIRDSYKFQVKDDRSL